MSTPETAPELMQEVAFIGSINGRGPQLELLGLIDLEKSVATEGGEEVTSVRGLREGLNEYPFKASGINKATFSNPHHSSCLSAKVNATVGLGFLSDEERKNGPQALNSSAVSGEQDPKKSAATSLLNPFYLPSKVDEVLDPVCEVSWNNTLMSVGHDFVRSGNGYFEVAREKSNPIDGKIVAIWWIPWSSTRPYVEDDTGRHWHWTLRDLNSGYIALAQFGKKKEMIERIENNTFSDAGATNIGEKVDPYDIHEVIHVPNPMGLHEIFGYPEWLAASAPMELIGAMMKYKFDFFTNRGVPEYALIVTGGKVKKENWDKIVKSLNRHVGAGNSHKSWALNLEDPDVVVKIEKLAMESTADTGIFKDKESLQADVVTAHRMPPLLGNILIPGKLGASNEFINSLLSFQLLTINSLQRIFQQILSATLGAGGGLGLERNDFILRKITDLIDVGKAETISRMRQELPQAKAEGRDVDEGLKD